MHSSTSSISLRPLRNPMANLSEDLFSEIIKFLTQDDGPSETWNSWTAVTHVCRRWRQVLIESPRLWSRLRITPFRHKQVGEFLQRSLTLPLDVHIELDRSHLTSDSSSFCKSLQLALDHISRIRVLHIHVICHAHRSGYVGLRGVTDSVFNSLQVPAPCLEEFSMRVTGRRSPLQLARGCPDFQLFLPGPLFAGSAPALKSVTVGGCYMPWDSSTLRGLSYFRLDDTVSNRITMSELLTILEFCPNLEVLHLENSGPEDEVFPWTRSINLPSLRQITLHMEASICANLLGRLILPPDANYTLHCHSYPDFDPISIVPSSLTADLQSLKIVMKRSPYNSEQKMIVLSACDSTKPTRMDLNVSWSCHSLVERLETLAIVVGKVVSADVTSLDLHVSCDEEGTSKASWMALFTAMPALRTLTYESGSNGVRMDTEEALAEAVLETLQTSHPCPNLRQIECRDAVVCAEGGHFVDRFEECAGLRLGRGHLPVELIVAENGRASHRYMAQASCVLNAVSEDAKSMEGVVEMQRDFISHHVF